MYLSFSFFIFLSFKTYVILGKRFNPAKIIREFNLDAEIFLPSWLNLVKNWYFLEFSWEILGFYPLFSRHATKSWNCDLFFQLFLRLYWNFETWQHWTDTVSFETTKNIVAIRATSTSLFKEKNLSVLNTQFSKQPQALGHVHNMKIPSLAFFLSIRAKKNSRRKLHAPPPCCVVHQSTRFFVPSVVIKTARTRESREKEKEDLLRAEKNLKEG